MERNVKEILGSIKKIHLTVNQQPFFVRRHFSQKELSSASPEGPISTGAKMVYNGKWRGLVNATITFCRESFQLPEPAFVA